MRATVDYSGGSLDLSLDPERVVATWSGPPGRSGQEVATEVRERLLSPLDFPPIQRAVVPGDRVVIAVDGDIPERSAILGPIVDLLESAGVARGDILILIAPGANPLSESDLPPGVAHAVHDPSDRDRLAYLATTEGGRRIYLNREVVEADFVLPLGLLAVDPALGIGGPWGTIFPGLGDVEARTHVAGAGSSRPGSALDVSTEVGWLLGNQFQVAVVPGASGIMEVLAGSGESVLKMGREHIDSSWTLRVDRRSEVVLVGVGTEPSLDSLWRAFATGASLVRRGGKVVALSSSTGPLGPAASRLSGAERPGPSSLKGAEREADYPAALALAESLAWADLYLFSALDPDVVEDLGIIPLSQPGEARRLVQAGGEVTLVNRAELTRVEVAEDRA